jgi:hypothetical protein
MSTARIVCPVWPTLRTQAGRMATPRRVRQRSQSLGSAAVIWVEAPNNADAGSAASDAALLDTTARVGKVAGMPKPKRKTSVEEVKRAAQLLLEEEGHRFSRRQKQLLRRTAETGVIVEKLVPIPAGWFLVHVVSSKRSVTIPLWTHDLPKNSAPCDCDLFGPFAHHVLLDADSRRVALDAIDRARERLRANPRPRSPAPKRPKRRGPPRGRRP